MSKDEYGIHQGVEFCPYCSSSDVNIKFKWNEDDDWKKDYKKYNEFICYHCGSIFKIEIVSKHKVSDDD